MIVNFSCHFYSPFFVLFLIWKKKHSLELSLILNLKISKTTVTLALPPSPPPPSIRTIKLLNKFEMNFAAVVVVVFDNFIESNFLFILFKIQGDRYADRFLFLFLFHLYVNGNPMKWNVCSDGSQIWHQMWLLSSLLLTLFAKHTIFFFSIHFVINEQHCLLKHEFYRLAMRNNLTIYD